MATTDEPNISFPNALYQEVRDWAAKQEAFEKENKTPAPLNDVERAFLDGLRRPSPSTPLDSGKDYVSLLCQYRQMAPTGNKITFVDGIHPVRNALGNPQWTCTVELSETSVYEPGIKSFPSVGFGLDVAGGYPPFAKKKDAKQYAAKCAIDWLGKESLLPTSLRYFALPQDTLPVMQSQSAKRQSEGTNGVLSPPPKRKTKGTNGTVDVEDENLPATQRVSVLCQSMSLKAPSYRVTPADSRVNYVFNGYPDFGDDEDSFDFPEGLGRITNVCGKDAAKQEIAEQLLPHLLKMYRERTAQYEPYS